MHHEPSKVLWYWLQNDRIKTFIHTQTFGKWLNLCLWNSNFVWGKDMHIEYTVGLICLLALIEGLRAHNQTETGQAVLKNYISSNTSIYTIENATKKHDKTCLRMFQQEAPTTLEHGAAGTMKTGARQEFNFSW